MPKARQKESGFTLIELLVTIAVFGIILTGILKVFNLHYRSYAVQEEIAAMQQNIRVAKMFLERDVRMAACSMANLSQEDGRVYPLIFENAQGATGSDKLTIMYVDYGAAPCGDSGDPNTPPCDHLPQLMLTNSMPQNSAEAVVNEDLTQAPYSAWDDDCFCGGTTYTQPTPGFKVIITSPNGSQSDVVYLTGVQPFSNKLQNAPYSGFTNKVLNTYPAGSTIIFFNEDALTEVAYDVVDGVLRRNTQPVAENIEDLQFAFGLDTDDDGTVDSWINNADLTDSQKDQVRSVRISVLGRTAKEDGSFSGSRPAVEDHAASETSDGYRRKLLQVTVKVRNLGL